MVPPLEFVRSPYCVQHFLPRLQTEMVCVIEAEPTSCRFKLLGSESFQRRLGSDGHEHWQVDSSVGQRHDGRTRPSCLFSKLAPVARQVAQCCHKKTKLTEHFATSSKVRAAEDADVEAILLAAHMFRCFAARRWALSLPPRLLPCKSLAHQGQRAPAGLAGVP